MRADSKNTTMWLSRSSAISWLGACKRPGNIAEQIIREGKKGRDWRLPNGERPVDQSWRANPDIRGGKVLIECWMPDGSKRSELVIVEIALSALRRAAGLDVESAASEVPEAEPMSQTDPQRELQETLIRSAVRSGYRRAAASEPSLPVPHKRGPTKRGRPKGAKYDDTDAVHWYRELRAHAVEYKEAMTSVAERMKGLGQVPAKVRRLADRLSAVGLVENNSDPGE